MLILTTITVFGQDMRFQVWTDFNLRLEFKNKLQLNIEPGYRFENESGVQNGYFRSALRYSPKPIIAFDLGLANFNVWDAKLLNSFELRTFQFAFINFPEVWEFRFQVRVGLEQRWFRFPDLDENEFVHRARLRVALRSPYFDFWDGPAKLFLTTNYEALRDVNEELIDVLVNENRVMVGLGFLDGKNLRLEGHYQIMGLRDRAVGELVRDINLVRIRAFYFIRPN